MGYDLNSELQVLNESMAKGDKGYVSFNKRDIKGESVQKFIM